MAMGAPVGVMICVGLQHPCHSDILGVSKHAAGFVFEPLEAPALTLVSLTSESGSPTLQAWDPSSTQRLPAAWFNDIEGAALGGVDGVRFVSGSGDIVAWTDAPSMGTLPVRASELKIIQPLRVGYPKGAKDTAVQGCEQGEVRALRRP